MTNIKLIIDGEVKLEREVEHVQGNEIVQFFNMMLDYIKLHGGNKIKMLKGLQGLK